MSSHTETVQLRVPTGMKDSSYTLKRELQKRVKWYGMVWDIPKL